MFGVMFEDVEWFIVVRACLRGMANTVVVRIDEMQGRTQGHGARRQNCLPDCLPDRLSDCPPNCFGAGPRHTTASSWVLLLILSIWLATSFPAPALAQSGGFGGGGALGGLLDQLQTLQGSGAIDALEGRAPSLLNPSREQGAAAVSSIQDNAAARAAQNQERQGLLNPGQQILAERFCRDDLTLEQGEAIALIRQFSPLERDYCRRASTLLLQYGYDLFGRAVDLQALDTGTIFPDYVLGIGDELVVTFIGQLSQSLTVRIDRKGRLLLPNFKPIFAAGHSFGEVRREIAARTAMKHLGTEVYVSLGAVRLVNVLVLGEVHEPGQKQLTALGSVIDAIRLGGGIKKTGSVRRIHVQRGDQVFWIDAYDLLFSGIAARDLTLRSGDRIIVPSLGPTFALAGDVKRPGIYEMAEGKRSLSLAAALKMSGGTLRPRGNMFHHVSFLDSGHQQLQEHRNLAAKVQDGDIVRVSRSQNIQLGAVDIQGHVHVAGRRALAATASVAKLLGDASSLKADPYLLFGALETTDPNTRARRLFPVNLQAILQGKQDYALRDGDRLLVMGRGDINYLSSANVQDVVSQRIDAELRQQDLEAEGSKAAAGTGPGADNTEQLLDDPVAALQQALAGGGKPAGALANLKAEAGDKGESLEDSLRRTCAGMRQLLAIVSVNSANRFANAVRTIDTAGMERVNRQDCPAIYDDHGGLLPLALEHAVAVNGEVRSPGAYPVVGTVSLTELIAVAGGLSREVDLTRVEVSRYTPDSLQGASNSTRGMVNLAQIGADKVMVGPGDVVRFNPVVTDRDTGPVLLVGEFTRPGLYEIRRGERLSEVIARAGGLTAQAYPYGGVFTRQRVRAAQRAGLQRAQRELSSSLAVVAVQRNVNPSSVLALQRFAKQLGAVEALGRVVTETDPTVLQVRPELDAVLEPGDRLYMPKRPNFVTVIGDVLNPGAMQFIAGTTADEYIRQAGGFQRSADEDRIFVVYPNGQAEPLAVSVWNYNPIQLPPGSSLVIPKDPAPLDLFTLVREGSSLISQLAVTAASLAVISRD
jgi:polysaccharide biosynthesis/export protein